jgi:hypothetical protein
MAAHHTQIKNIDMKVLAFLCRMLPLAAKRLNQAGKAEAWRAIQDTLEDPALPRRLRSSRKTRQRHMVESILFLYRDSQFLVNQPDNPQACVRANSILTGWSSLQDTLERHNSLLLQCDTQYIQRIQDGKVQHVMEWQSN